MTLFPEEYRPYSVANSVVIGIAGIAAVATLGFALSRSGTPIEQQRRDYFAAYCVGHPERTSTMRVTPLRELVCIDGKVTELAPDKDSPTIGVIYVPTQ